MSIPTHKLDSIQVVRALAVVLVVYAHSIDSSVKYVGTSGQSAFFYLENWGAIGLDLFFVVSGFIMTRIIHSYQRAGGWKLFAFKRALRIIPLYWSLSLVTALFILRTSPIEPSAYWKTVLFLPVFETEFAFPVIDVGWSLSYEIYFYLLISIVLLFHFKRPQTMILLLLGLVSAVGVVIDEAEMPLQFFCSPLLLEFALGIGCGMAYDQFQPGNRWHRWGMFICFAAGLALMVGPVFWGYGDISEAETVITRNSAACWRSLIWGLPCALFLTGSTLLERVYALSMPSVLIRIGDASYSNYLLHGLVIAIARKTVSKLPIGEDACIILLVMLCTGLSLVMYQLIEKPLLEQLNRYFFPKNPKAISVTTAV